MTKQINRLSLAFIDQDADGVPESAVVSYVITSKDDRSYKHHATLHFDFNPFDTVIAATRLALERVAEREGITLDV